MTTRILVADDSITIQKIVAMAFENEDAEVEGIGNGQEAFEKIPDFKPDIILADVDMPGLDGFQLSQKIKETPEFASIKVLLLASDFEDFDENRFKKSKADNHISKPFKSDDIVQMVTQVLTGTNAGESVEVLSVEAPAELSEPIGDEPALFVEELASPEELEADSEPSLEELLESVERLSTDSQMAASPPIEEVEENIADSVELTEPAAEPEESINLAEPVDLAESLEAVDASPEPIELAEPVAEPEESEDINEEPASMGDNDILDQIIQEVDSHLEEQIELSDSKLPMEDAVLEEQEEEALSFAEEDYEVFAEVQPRKMENLDDLDSAFKEIVSGDHKAKLAISAESKEPEISALGGIVPEPEDLLERMAPGAFSDAERRPHTAEEMQENLNYISGRSSLESIRADYPYQDSRLQGLDYENNDERFIQVTGEQVRQILERSLDTSLQKEISGMSEIIVKTIREVVREITPEIARSVIREEIEKIKKI